MVGMAAIRHTNQCISLNAQQRYTKYAYKCILDSQVDLECEEHSEITISESAPPLRDQHLLSMFAVYVLQKYQNFVHPEQICTMDNMNDHGLIKRNLLARMR
jgi:hypothetical protein